MSASFRVRTEVDFIALAPIVLGFYPHDSLVMMTFGAQAFHARIDLPDEDNVKLCIDSLLQPAVQHSVGQVAFVMFDSDDHTTLQKALVETFASAGLNIVAALEFRAGEFRQFGSRTWKPFDIASHPLTLEAQFNDVAPAHQSREALVDSIKPRGSGWSEETDQAIAHLMEVGVESVIDAFTRVSAKEATELWCEVLRHTQPDSKLSQDVALAVAFAAWLKGDGALSWAALDLADGSTKLWRVMYTVLSKAVSPDEWPRK